MKRESMEVIEQYLSFSLAPSHRLSKHSSTGKSRGQRSLVGYRPWGRKEWDTTERLPFHYHQIVLVGILNELEVFF